MKVKALKRHSYGKKIRPVGCTYEISEDSHVKLLVALKKVDVIIESFDPEPAASKPTRVYKRRDMKAERSNAAVTEEE